MSSLKNSNKAEKTYLTTTPFQTKKLGESLAKKVLKVKTKKMALVLGLEGDLGGGKTTFLQGFAKGLGIRQKVLSPTFIIMRRFKIKNLKLKIKNFYHFDCYRISEPKELFVLDFKEIIKNPKNIVAIEWAEKIKKIIPQGIIWIKFEFVDKKRRKIKLKYQIPNRQNF